MTFKPKFLFLGACAADQGLVREMADAGLMPVFKSLLEKGVSGQTRSVDTLYVQCNWPAFYTGTGPAKLGIHSWEQMRPGTYDMYRAYTPDHVQSTAFWDYLSESGHRCAVLDIPHSGASRRINGVQLVEWGAHDANHGIRSAPASLADEILRQFGDHPHRGLCDADRSGAEFIELRDGLLRGIDTKVEITKHFLAQENWDFFAQVFTESHCIGHQCWHLHDRSHPRFDAAEHMLVGDPVTDIYMAIDRAIGRILDCVDDETNVLVLASHGMNSKYNPQFMLGDILVRLGVAAPKRSTAAAPTRSFKLKRGLDSVLTKGWQMVPPAAIDWMNPLRQRLRDVVKTPSDAMPTLLEPADSDCFIITNNHTHGGIRVNLAGREPAGRIRPGAEYEAFLARLDHDLLQIKNVETGKRVVSRVIRNADLYPGERTAHFPDLYVEWCCTAPVNAIESEKIGRIAKSYGYCRTGEHNPAGMFVATGPAIKPERLDRVVSIMDFAPTFCEAMDVRVEGFDGTAISEVVDGFRAGVSRHKTGRRASDSDPRRQRKPVTAT